VVLVAMGAGGAMGAAAGARRTASAGDRLAARSAVPETFVYAPDPEVFNALINVPEVAAASGLTALGLQPEGVPCNDEEGSYFPIVVPVAGTPFAVPRPRLRAGRFPDPTNPTDALISEQHARRLRVGVGDHIRYLPYLLGQDNGDVVGCGDTVVAEVEVVGIVRELFEIGAGDEPTLANTYLTGAFIAAHPDVPQIGIGVGGLVDLAPGVDQQEFADGLGERAPKGEDGAPLAGAVLGFSGSSLQPALDAGAVGLWALALVVGLVAVTFLALGFIRQVETSASELRLLAVLGMRRRHRASAAAALGCIVVAIALPLAMGLAAAISTVHLVGLAATVEPEPGFDLDPFVLAVGALGVVLVGGGIIAAAAWRAASLAGQSGSRQPVSTRPGVAERFAAVGAPPWMTMGADYALGRGRRTTLPARTAIIGVIVGTAGVLGVLIFGLGVGRASSDASVYGWGTWDAMVFSDQDPATQEVDPGEVLSDDPDVAAAALVQHRFKLKLDGQVVNGVAVEAIRGRSGPTVVQGRLPAGLSEIALGSATTDALRAGIGATVEAARPEGGTARMTVVGIAAFPSVDGDSLAAGWTADRSAIDALGWPPGCNDEAECTERYAVTWRDGADVKAAAARLMGLGLTVDAPAPGAAVVLIGEADALPRVAAGVVALVAVVGLTHTLAVTIARRRRELAVVRALGFDRRQVRRVLHAEGLVLGVVGALTGGLAGVIIGGLAWRAAARAIGIGPHLPSSVGLVLAVLASVVALAALLSVVPARFAVRSAPAVGLREER
jgi:hypothetical protein